MLIQFQKRGRRELQGPGFQSQRRTKQLFIRLHDARLIISGEIFIKIWPLDWGTSTEHGRTSPSGIPPIIREKASELACR